MRAFGLFGSVANELHFCHCAGCRTFFAHLCAHLLRSAVLYLSVLKHRVDRLQTYFFLPCLSSDCAGVWPFRIRCQRASFLSLCRLPHVFCPPMCSPTAVCGPVPVCFKAPCGQVANVLFLICLSSDCAGVWPFRIRCQRCYLFPKPMRMCGKRLERRPKPWIKKTFGSSSQNRYTSRLVRRRRHRLTDLVHFRFVQPFWFVVHFTDLCNSKKSWT